MTLSEGITLTAAQAGTLALPGLLDNFLNEIPEIPIPQWSSVVDNIPRTVDHDCLTQSQYLECSQKLPLDVLSEHHIGIRVASPKCNEVFQSIAFVDIDGY